MDSSASPLHSRRLLSRHVNSPDAFFFGPLALTRIVHVGRYLESKLPFISDAISNQHSGQPRLGTAACMFGTLGAAPLRVPILQAPLPGGVMYKRPAGFPSSGLSLLFSFLPPLMFFILTSSLSSHLHLSIRLLKELGAWSLNILIPFPSTH